MARGLAPLPLASLLLCMALRGTAVAAEPEPSLDDQISAADAARKDGRLADGARLYAEAYRTAQASDDYRGSDPALEMVVLAAKLYHEAFRASNRDYALCDESKALLETFVAEWEALGQPIPKEVTEELQWLEARLAERPPEPVPEPEPTPDETDDTGAQEPVVPTPIAEPEPTPPPRDRGPDRVGWGLVGGGAAFAVTGAVLLAVGVPLRGRAEDYRAQVMGSPEFTGRGSGDQAVALEYLDGYVHDERRRGVTLMAAGGAVLGVGVATLVVGGIRLLRPGRSAGGVERITAVSPTLGLDRRGAQLGISLGF